jgi:hypothetical protein
MLLHFGKVLALLQTPGTPFGFSRGEKQRAICKNLPAAFTHESRVEIAEFGESSGFPSWTQSADSTLQS